MEAQLVFPDYCHETVMKKFANDILEYDKSDMINGSGFYLQYKDDFISWIKKEKHMHLGIEMEAELVPGTTFLYMMNNEIVGIINVRHSLNDYLLKVGGNIGYSIHPRYRRQGFATKMLSEALEFCKVWEITPVLVTCDKDNIASRKTIEKCGGVFENEYKEGAETILRFWIGEKQ
ncbi:MAG: GNAT family N-acetyltransferase [Coprobacillus sp.]